MELLLFIFVVSVGVAAGVLGFMAYAKEEKAKD